MQSTNPTEHTEFSIRVRIHVLQARGLAVKDSNGMSDPYVKIRIGGHSFTTQYIPKTLNPVWDASFEFDIETQSVPDQVNLMFWDKDRFTKDDFMGVARWYELKTLPGKPSNVSGEVEIKFGLVDTALAPANKSSREYCRRVWDVLVKGRDDFDLGQRQIRNPEENTTFSMAEIPLAVSETETSPGYIDNQHSSSLVSPIPSTKSLHGVVFMEIVSAANLPKTPNVLRTGYDMDPFVVISFGKYIFRTRVVRHNCDPVWNAKLMFRVYHDEDSFLVKFSIHDWDKLSENDSVGTVTMPINDLIQAAGAQDDVLVNHPQSPLAMNGVPNIDPDMKDYIHTIVIDETVKVTAENPQLRVRAKFVPYTTLRRRFWYGLANAFGNDNHHGFYPKVLIQGMLENLGSTLSNETIDGFFEHFHKNPESDKLTFDELYERLEQRVKLDDGVVMKEPNLFKKLFRRSISKTQEGQNLRDMTDTSEHIIRISTCPICQDPSLGQKSETDVITHIAVCSGNDGFNLDKLIMGNFVTEENAQRKWITKFVKSLSFGQCIVGENNANIIVQERYKGLRTEEKMPTYIRLGIRLLYQGSGNKILANKFLANTSWRQGAKYNDPKSKRDIQPFIHFHQLDLHMAEEVLEPIQQFKNFNEFFYRKLKPGARTLSSPGDDRVAVSVADCRMTCFQTISDATEFWIKGEHFSPTRLLSNEDLAKTFDGGSLAIFRLAPQDYHRFHIPVAGTLSAPQDISGEYYTVNPMAIRSKLDVYGENKRVVSTIQSKEFGTVAYVAIGAMMVGSINLTTNGNGHQVNRMDEHGYFAFGGSTIVLLFEPNSIQFDDDLLDTSRHQIEMLVKVGMKIGTSTRA